MAQVTVHIDPEVKNVIALFDGLLETHKPDQSIQHYFEQLADRLHFRHKNRDIGIRFIVCQHFREYDLNKVFDAEFSIADAKLCIAKQHGFENWEAVETVEHYVDIGFETLIDKMLAGDLQALQKAIGDNPNIIHQTSAYPHRATLLHYTGSNGVEAYRQVVPLNLADIVNCLLEAGADPKLEANIYGGCKARDLLETSKHPYESGVIKSVQSVYDKRQAAS